GKGNERRVELLSGEALFDFAQDKGRTFDIILDRSEIHGFGTRLNVYRKDNGDTVVTVLEGSIEVRGLGRDEKDVRWVRNVRANEQIEYRSIDLISEPHSTNAVAAVTWRSGLIQLPEDGRPLGDVIVELSRYTDARIVLRDPQI